MSGVVFNRSCFVGLDLKAVEPTMVDLVLAEPGHEGETVLFQLITQVEADLMLRDVRGAGMDAAMVRVKFDRKTLRKFYLAAGKLLTADPKEEIK